MQGELDSRTCWNGNVLVGPKEKRRFWSQIDENLHRLLSLQCDLLVKFEIFRCLKFPKRNFSFSRAEGHETQDDDSTVGLPLLQPVPEFAHQKAQLKLETSPLREHHKHSKKLFIITTDKNAAQAEKLLPSPARDCVICLCVATYRRACK